MDQNKDSRHMKNSSSPGDDRTKIVLLVARIIAAVALLILSINLDKSETTKLFIQGIAAVLVGVDLIFSAARDIKNRIITGESLLVLVAVLLSFTLKQGAEGAVALIILQVSFLLRRYAISSAESRLLLRCSFSAQEDEHELPNPGANFSNACETLRGGYASPTELSQKLISISRLFVVSILVISVAVLVFIPLRYEINFEECLRRVITLIAIASPFGMLLSVPLSYLSCMVAGCSKGVLFKDSNTLENVSRVKALVFDKTGTITRGSYVLSEIISDRMDHETFLKVAAYASAGSDEPAFRAIVSAYGKSIHLDMNRNFLEYPGKGVSVTIDGIEILLGSAAFLSERHAEPLKDYNERSAVYMSVDGQYAGCLIFKESVNPQAQETIRKLAQSGERRITMISGDSRKRDCEVAEQLGITEYYAECSEEDKAINVSELKKKIAAKNVVAYVGGTTREVLPGEAADVNMVIMGNNGADSLPDADVIIGGSIKVIPTAMNLATHLQRVILVGMCIGLLVKLIIAALAIAGLAPLWFGLLIDNCIVLALIIDSLNVKRYSGIE